MTPPSPRNPKKSSRAATPRPRRIAGGGASADPGTPAEEPTVEEPTAEEPIFEESVPEPDLESGPEPEPWPVEDPAPSAGEGSALHSPRATRMLLFLVGGLAIVLLVQAGWMLRHSGRDEPESAARSAEGAIEVPSDRPVAPTELVVQEGVEAAAKAAEKIVTRTYENYDAEVDETTELMTDDFAAEYRETTDDVRDQFIARKTTVQVRVVGQGVVRANDTELQALVFLNQYVIRDTGKDPKTTYTPYRALLTMVNTDDGWLVDDLRTE